MHDSGGFEMGSGVLELGTGDSVPSTGGFALVTVDLGVVSCEFSQVVRRQLALRRHSMTGRM